MQNDVSPTGCIYSLSDDLGTLNKSTYGTCIAEITNLFVICECMTYREVTVFVPDRYMLQLWLFSLLYSVISIIYYTAHLPI